MELKFTPLKIIKRIKVFYIPYFRFQRIRIVPPSGCQFSISDICYPDKSKGDIAPGMSTKMNVNFNASSLQDFNDII